MMETALRVIVVITATSFVYVGAITTGGATSVAPTDATSGQTTLSPTSFAAAMSTEESNETASQMMTSMQTMTSGQSSSSEMSNASTDEPGTGMTTVMMGQSTMTSSYMTTSMGTSPMTETSAATITPSMSPEASTPGQQPSTPTLRMASTTSQVTTVTDMEPDKGGLSKQNAAIIGGVCGGVAFVIIVVIVLFVVCRSASRNRAVVTEDGVKHREKKKKTKDGSKKHRSAILSLRHKIPLFSTPFAESDNDDDDEGGNVNGAAENVPLEWRPQSKIPSQIRVDLSVADEGLGTIENGFLPTVSHALAASNETDGGEDYGNGALIHEGRFGIHGPGTFTAPHLEPNKDKTSHTNEEDYQQVNDNDKPGVTDDEHVYDKPSEEIQPNVPGNFAYDNALYVAGPVGQPSSASPETDDATETVNDVNEKSNANNDGEMTTDDATETVNDVNKKSDADNHGEMTTDDINDVVTTPDADYAIVKPYSERMI